MELQNEIADIENKIVLHAGSLILQPKNLMFQLNCFRQIWLHPVNFKREPMFELGTQRLKQNSA